MNLIYRKTIKIYSTGINVIIHFGFWQRHYRDETNQYFNEHNITPEWHYIDINPFNVLYNHKVAMNVIIEYLIKNSYIQSQHLTEIKMLFNELERSTVILRNLVIKYNIAQSQSLLKKMYDYSVNLENEDRSVEKKLMNSLITE